MGRRGPNKKPYEQKALEGFAGGKSKAAPPLLSPDNDTEIPEPPLPLSPEQRAFWNRTFSVLIDIGNVCSLDHMAVARYCMNLAKLLECERKLTEQGLQLEVYIENEDGETELQSTKPNPYMTIYTKLNTAIRQFECDFGMTPTSRGNVAAGKGSMADGAKKKKLYG